MSVPPVGGGSPDNSAAQSSTKGNPNQLIPGTKQPRPPCIANPTESALNPPPMALYQGTTGTSRDCTKTMQGNPLQVTLPRYHAPSFL